jgi:hypothetical protein
VAVGALTAKSSASHTVHGKHDVALFSVLKWPSGQASQPRSWLALGEDTTCSPATQSVHGLHASTLVVLLKYPSAHALQLRSVVALPSAETKLPETQSVQATQAVAGSPSWSQLPTAHGWASASPPAQYWPATHASHSTGDVELAACV